MGHKKLRISRTTKYDTFYSLDCMYYLCVVEQNKYVLVICMHYVCDPLETELKWMTLDDIFVHIYVHMLPHYFTDIYLKCTMHAAKGGKGVSNMWCLLSKPKIQRQ